LTGMLATGRPVVACAGRNTQIAKVVSHRGIVVPPGQVDPFFHAISLLAEDSDLRMQLGARAREYAVKHLGKSAILKQFLLDLSFSESTVLRDVYSGTHTEREFMDERILAIENAHLQPYGPKSSATTKVPGNP